jgi:protein TonB
VNKDRRHLAGCIGSLFGHIALFILLALLGFFTAEEPPNLSLQVALVGGSSGSGGGGPGASGASAAPRPVNPDDIVEARPPEQLTLPPARRTERTEEKPPEKARSPVAGQTEETGNFAGEGSGPGTAAGTGSGTGSGGGQGDGRGGGSGTGAASVLPRLTYYQEPDYPSSAISAGAEGTVHIRLAVSARGAVTAVTLTQSSGWRDIDGSVLRAAKQWRFSPAQDTRGRGIACTVDLPVNFRLRRR